LTGNRSSSSSSGGGGDVTVTKTDRSSTPRATGSHGILMTPPRDAPPFLASSSIPIGLNRSVQHRHANRQRSLSMTGRAEQSIDPAYVSAVLSEDRYPCYSATLCIHTARNRIEVTSQYIIWPLYDRHFVGIT